MRGIRKTITDNLPVILTSVAIGGVVSTTVLAVRATPEATRQIWDAQSELGREITKTEVVRLVWKQYVPAALMGTVTIAAIVGAHGVHTKRQAVIAGLYSLTERSLSEYREKVLEVVGDKKEQSIRDAIAEDRIKNNPVTASEVVIIGNGEQLCYDSISGRYFMSDQETIRAARNEINAQCNSDMYASQNDFYRLIGLPPTVFGEEQGWRSDHHLDVSFSSHISDDGRPCLSLDYHMSPIRGYYKGF